MSRIIRKWWIDALFFVSIALAVAGLARLASGPYLGFSFKAGPDGIVVFDAPLPGSPAERLFRERSELAGSRVLSVAGVPLESDDLVEDPDYLGDRDSIARFFVSQRRLWVSLADPREVSISYMVPGGAIYEAGAAPLRMGLPRAIARSGLMLFLGTFSICAGYLVVRRRPRDGNAIRFFLMTVSVMLIFSSFGIYTARDLVYSPVMFILLFYQNTIAFSAFFVLFPFFFLNFPREFRLFGDSAARWGLAALAGAAFAVSISRVFGSLSNLFFLVGLFVGIVAILVRYVRAHSATERYQIRWIFWGTLLFVLVFSATAIVPSLVIGRRLVSDRIPSLFFTLVPLSILFAIEKYHLMDIDRLIDASLAYFASLALFSAADLLVFWAIRALIPERMAVSALLSSLAVCWAFILVYNPIRERILAGVRLIFGRREPNPLRSMEALSARMAGIPSVEAACASFRAFIIDEFGASDAYLRLFVPGASGGTEEVAAGPAPDLAVGAVPERPVFAFQLERSRPGQDHDDDVVIVPIHRPRSADRKVAEPGFPAPGAAPAGYAVLQGKRVRVLYSRAELSLLGVLAGEFALRVQALVAAERVSRINREALREKERIARDIHDGLGSALSVSLLLTGKLERADGAETRARLSELRRMLEDGLSELRTLVWTMADGGSDFAALVGVIRSRLLAPVEALGFSCALEADKEIEARPIDSSVCMNLYRIVQEFLTNCAKYQQPGRIIIAFEVGDGAFVCRLRCPSPLAGARMAGELAGGMGMENIERRARDLGARLVRDATTGPWGFDLVLPSA